MVCLLLPPASQPAASSFHSSHLYFSCPFLEFLFWLHEVQTKQMWSESYLCVWDKSSSKEWFFSAFWRTCSFPSWYIIFQRLCVFASICVCLWVYVCFYSSLKNQCFVKPYYFPPNKRGGIGFLLAQHSPGYFSRSCHLLGWRTG